MPPAALGLPILPLGTLRPPRGRVGAVWGLVGPADHWVPPPPVGMAGKGGGSVDGLLPFHRATWTLVMH